MYLRALFFWYSEKFKLEIKLLELTKNKSKIHENKLSQKSALTFNEWWAFFRKPWANKSLIMTFLQILLRIITTRNFYPSSFKLEVGILPPWKYNLPWRFYVMWTQSFSCKLNSSKAYSFWNIPYLSLWL